MRTHLTGPGTHRSLQAGVREECSAAEEGVVQRQDQRQSALIRATTAQSRQDEYEYGYEIRMHFNADTLRTARAGSAG